MDALFAATGASAVFRHATAKDGMTRFKVFYVRLSLFSQYATLFHRHLEPFNQYATFFQRRPKAFEPIRATAFVGGGPRGGGVPTGEAADESAIKL